MVPMNMITKTLLSLHQLTRVKEQNCPPNPMNKNICMSTCEAIGYNNIASSRQVEISSSFKNYTK